MTIWVLEDDAVYGPALCRSLKREGMETVLFTTVEALLGADGRPDVALVDLRLPDGSGVDAVRHLVPVPVVVLTGHGSIPAAVECMRTGAVDFLTKPVSTDELVGALQRAARPAPPAPDERLDAVERDHILRVLEDADGNISEAARRLGLYRRTLQRKLQKLGQDDT